MVPFGRREKPNGDCAARWNRKGEKLYGSVRGRNKPNGGCALDFLAWAFRANRSLGLAKPAPILSRHWFKPACVSRNIELGSPWTAARSPSATLRGETGFCKIYQGKSGRWAPALEKWRKSSKPEKAEVLLVRWRGCILAAICRAPGKSQSKTKWRIGNEKDALDCVGHVLAGGIVDARDGEGAECFRRHVEV
jgi:hypothetical protein